MPKYDHRGRLLWTHVCAAVNTETFPGGYCNASGDYCDDCGMPAPWLRPADMMQRLLAPALGGKADG